MIDSDQPDPFDENESSPEESERLPGGEAIIRKSVDDIHKVEQAVGERLGLESGSAELVEATDEALVYIASESVDSDSTSHVDKMDAVEDVVVESAIEADVANRPATETPLAQLEGEDFESLFKSIEEQFARDHATLPSGHEAAPIVEKIIAETESSRLEAENVPEWLESVRKERKQLEADAISLYNRENENVDPAEKELVWGAYNALIDDVLLRHVANVRSWKWMTGQTGHGIVLETLDSNDKSMVHVEILKATGEADPEGVREAQDLNRIMLDAVGSEGPTEREARQLHERISIQLGGEGGEAWTYFAYDDGSVRRMNTPSEVLESQDLNMVFSYYATQAELGLGEYQVSAAEIDELRELLASPHLLDSPDSYTNLVFPPED